jgi:hypothetical protein
MVLPPLRSAALAGRILDAGHRIAFEGKPKVTLTVHFRVNG